MTPFNMTPFKMENGHFCTDETKGKPHLPDQPTGPKGSVFQAPCATLVTTETAELGWST